MTWTEWLSYIATALYVFGAAQGFRISLPLSHKTPLIHRAIFVFLICPAISLMTPLGMFVIFLLCFDRIVFGVLTTGRIRRGEEK